MGAGTPYQQMNAVPAAQLQPTGKAQQPLGCVMAGNKKARIQAGFLSFRKG